MAATDDLSLPVHEIPSHGFVEVGEGTNREGTYNLLKRNSFTLGDIGKTNETLFSLYRHLHRDIQALEAELAVLRRKAIVHNRWDHRYSKRMAVMANLLLGVWTFWYHLIKCARRRKASIIQAMMAGKAYEDRNFHWLLKDGYVEGIKNGWIFFFFSFLLTRPLAWARWLGIASSISWSLYLAIFGKFLPWTNYFNVLANLLYVTASLNRTQKKELPSIDCFLFETERRTTYANAAAAAAVAAAIEPSAASASPSPSPSYASYSGMLERRASKSPPTGSSVLPWPPRSNSLNSLRNPAAANNHASASGASYDAAVVIPSLTSTSSTPSNLQPTLGLDTYNHKNNTVARRARSGSFITPPHAPESPTSPVSSSASSPSTLPSLSPSPSCLAADTPAQQPRTGGSNRIRTSDTSADNKCVLARVPPGDPPANVSSPQCSPRT